MLGFLIVLASDEGFFFSVQIILYHKDRRALVFVKQFRPCKYETTLGGMGYPFWSWQFDPLHSFLFLAVYLHHIPADENGSYDSVDWSKYPASLGYTLELCAGIIDKNKPIIEIVREEVLEECGYSVPVSQIERVTSYR